MSSAVTTESAKRANADLVKAASLDLFNHKGDKISFSDAILSHDGVVILVFIRHFWCGNCQRYTAELASKVVPKANVLVIGCGDWELIQQYHDMTDFPPERIFANPDRSVYRALGITTETLSPTPKGETKKSYLPTNYLSSVWKSIVSGPFSHPVQTLTGKQGNLQQLGAEFIFKDKECIFAYHMKHTEDHTEIEDLLNMAGIPKSSEAT